MIEVIFSAHTNIEWDCLCGHHNTEEEGRMDYGDGDYISCHKCGKSYVFVESASSFSKLALVEDVED